MNLETQRLILRPLVLEDHVAIQRHFPHWDVVKYLTTVVEWPYPDDGAYRFLTKIALPNMATGEHWYWGLTLKGYDEVIGVIHLRRNSEKGNRGLWLSVEHQGKGYMPEALEAVNDYAFDTLGFHELIVKNAHENKASHKLKERTGFTLQAVVPAKEGHYIGGCRNQEIWQLTCDNWHMYKSERLKKQQILAGQTTIIETADTTMVTPSVPLGKIPRLALVRYYQQFTARLRLFQKRREKQRSAV